MMKKVILLSTAVVTLLISGCNSGKNNNLVGIWQLKAMNVNGTSIQGGSMGNWLWEFNRAGGYMVDISGMREKGVYHFNDTVLAVQITSVKNKPEQSFTIQHLDSVNLTLLSVDGPNKSILQFRKRNVKDVVKTDND